jgi:hypothetical protein
MKKLHDNMDAQDWAKTFMELHGDRLEEIDEGLMCVWFSNAIMCGYDTANRTRTDKDGIAATL